MSLDSVHGKVHQRVSEYEEREDRGEKDKWFAEWFEPVLGRIDIKTLSWESIIAEIETSDPQSANRIGGFYEHCLTFGQRAVLDSAANNLLPDEY